MKKPSDIPDSFVDAVEDQLSMGHAAWDMVDPREIIAAVLNCESGNYAAEKVTGAAARRMFEKLNDSMRPE